MAHVPKNYLVLDVEGKNWIHSYVDVVRNTAEIIAFLYALRYAEPGDIIMRDGRIQGNLGFFLTTNDSLYKCLDPSGNYLLMLRIENTDSPWDGIFREAVRAYADVAREKARYYLIEAGFIEKDTRQKGLFEASRACSLVRSMVRSTLEGSVDSAWQAEPVDAAISMSLFFIVLGVYYLLSME